MDKIVWGSSLSGGGVLAVVPSDRFTVDRNVRYIPTSRVWHLNVTIPGPGVVSAVEPNPCWTGASAQIAAKRLVESRKVGLKSVGKATLTLRLTSRGETMLSSQEADRGPSAPAPNAPTVPVEKSDGSAAYLDRALRRRRECRRLPAFVARAPDRGRDPTFSAMLDDRVRLV